MKRMIIVFLFIASSIAQEKRTDRWMVARVNNTPLSFIFDIVFGVWVTRSADKS